MRPHKSPALGTVLLLIALNLLNYLDRYILNGAQPLIQSEFHATDEMMGRLTTALFFFYMFAAPASGWLGDWLRRKPLIITGAILWSLATLGTAFVHTYWGLFARRALVGVGEATFGIYAPAVLADFYPERDRNRILSIFYLAIPVGAALGYLAGGELGSLWGQALSPLRHSWIDYCRTLWRMGPRAGARWEGPLQGCAAAADRFLGCARTHRQAASAPG